MKDSNLVILGNGFAGVGKSTHLQRLYQALKQLPHLNCNYIDKDLIATTLLGAESYFTEYYFKHVHHQSYQLMINLARDSIKLNTTNTIVILDGIFGDKIDKYVKDILGFREFNVKLIHFHCSGPKQRSRLLSRGHSRDSKHHLAKFNEYRYTQVKNHLLGLSQIDQYCVIDTEHDEQIAANIQQIIQYLESPSTVQLISQTTKAPLLPSAEEAMAGTATFMQLLDKLKQPPKYPHPHQLFHTPLAEKDKTPKTSTPLRAKL